MNLHYYLSIYDKLGEQLIHEIDISSIIDDVASKLKLNKKMLLRPYELTDKEVYHLIVAYDPALEYYVWGEYDIFIECFTSE